MEELKAKLILQLDRAIVRLEEQTITSTEELQNFMYIIQNCSQIISMLNNLK